MGPLPFALSIHNFISSVGADAGFASMIGLAILVLLYFAHARETATLRQEATELADRLQDAEGRLAQAVRSGAALTPGVRVTPAPATAAARPAAVPPAARPAPAAAMAPSAPAGVGAPALAAATRFVPVATRPAPAPAPAAAPAGEAVPSASTRAAPFEVPEPQTVAASRAHELPVGGPPRPAPAPAAATVAGAAAGGDAVAAGAPGLQTGNGGAQRAAREVPNGPRAPGGSRSLPARPGAAAGSARARFSTLSPPSRRTSDPGRIVAVVIGLVIVAAGVAALLVLTSNNGRQAVSTPARTSNLPARKHAAGPAFNPATVTVAVLNGTAVNNLAHRTAAGLTAQGYKQGTVATASDQTLTATTVGYLPGHRSDALHVARALGLGPASVQPVSQPTEQVACPGAGACSAGVVVTVGADLANS